MKKGQTLVMLLLILGIALTIISASVAVMIGNSRGETDYGLGLTAKSWAESGVENALMQLLRNPSYSGETLTTPESIVTITVTGATTKTIISRAVVNNLTRQIQATANFVDGVLNVLSYDQN